MSALRMIETPSVGLESVKVMKSKQVMVVVVVVVAVMVV